MGYEAAGGAIGVAGNIQAAISGDMPATARDHVRAMRAVLKKHLRAAMLFSVAYNILLLISPLYMIQVYDRVLVANSIETLILLTVMAVALYCIYGVADHGRRRVFALIGQRLGREFEPLIFARGAQPGHAGPQLEKAVADLGKVQGLFSAGTIQPIFDGPFAPMFAVLVFMVHPWLGWLTIVGILVLVALAWRAEQAATPEVEDAGRRETAASRFLADISRKLAVVRAMGMDGSMADRWMRLRGDATSAALHAGRVAGGYGAASRAARQMLQTLMLGMAAWLVMRQEISSGSIIASSILSGRCLAPVDQAIGAWKPFVKARQAWTDLCGFVGGGQLSGPQTALPRPEARLVLDEAVTAPPGADSPIVEAVSLVLEPGQILVVLGASGQGKTSFLNMLSTAWKPSSGRVALGGRDIHDWNAGDRGRWFGYMPQQIDLLPGTLRENIERFSGGSDEALFEAAGRIGIHQMALALPQGYDTSLGDGQSAILSAGQRQGVGLARAVYGDAVLLLLDEPSANLDAHALGALLAMLGRWREERRIAVVATHDLRLLHAADMVLEIQNRRTRLLSRDDYVRAMNPTAVAKATR